VSSQGVRVELVDGEDHALIDGRDREHRVERAAAAGCRRVATGGLRERRVAKRVGLVGEQRRDSAGKSERRAVRVALPAHACPDVPPEPRHVAQAFAVLVDQAVGVPVVGEVTCAMPLGLGRAERRLVVEAARRERVAVPRTHERHAFVNSACCALRTTPSK
jgi:hypothetical protein